MIAVQKSSIVIEFLKFLYSWVSTQPVYIQVAIGVLLLLLGLYVFCWIGGMIFLRVLMGAEKKNKEKDGIQRG
jgi:hypothetical protein